MSAPLKASHILKKSSGFTLMEIMMALPLGILTMSAIFLSFQFLTSNYELMKAKSESIFVQDQIRKIIMTPSSCTAHLQASTRTFDPSLATSGDLPLSFSLDDGISVVSSGVVLTKYDLLVHSLTFKLNAGGNNYMPDPLLIGNSFQYGTLVFAASKSSPLNQRYSAPEILGGLVLSVDGANNISRCFVLDDNFDFCSSIGGHLYFDGTKMNCFGANPCGNRIWAGVDATNTPICKSMNTLMSEACPANQFLVSNGAGSATCQVLGPPTASTPSVIPPAATPGPTPPPAPSDCSDPALTAGAGTSLSAAGFGGPPWKCCFFTASGVHAYVDVDLASGNLIISAGPVPNPLYPMSSFVSVTNPDGSKAVTGLNGSSCGP